MPDLSDYARGRLVKPYDLQSLPPGGVLVALELYDFWKPRNPPAIELATLAKEVLIPGTVSQYAVTTKPDRISFRERFTYSEHLVMYRLTPLCPCRKEEP